MLNQRGIALPLTLIVMVAITSLTLGLLSISAVEPRVSRNLTDAAQARFAAEAGLEWGYNQLVATTDWSGFLSAAPEADQTNGKPLTSLPSSIGTLPAAHGVFVVNVRNDSNNGDEALTGLPNKDPGGHLSDTNNTLILHSTGTVNGASRTLRAVIKKLVYPPGFFPGALSFPGVEAEVTFNGNAFEIDGRGRRTDGSLDSGCSSVYGISVSSVLPAPNPGANEDVVQSGLSSQQKDNVTGRHENYDLDDPSAPSTNGNNTIARNSVLTPEYIQNFIDQAKEVAHVTLESKQPSGLAFQNIGDSCDTNYHSNTCWGTKDKPKIVYIKGDPDPASMFNALQLSGNTVGHGILIVEDGDVRISGNFLWHGAIIVTGKWVGIGYMGGGNQVVYGAVISNETATDPGFKEGVVTGNAKIRYSCEALDNSLKIRELTSIVHWKELAPGE